jgi:hypothetical protein
MMRTIVPSVARVTGALNMPVLVANPFAVHRVPLHARNFPLVLLYTARAGSSALIKWFLFQTGHLDESAVLRRGVHRFERSVRLRDPWYAWKALRLVAFHEKPIFKLVRNPYDRAVSSFLSMIIHSRPEQANPWGRKPVASARQLAGKPAAASPALSFRDFLRFLAHNGTASGQINGHIARQHLAGEDRYIDRLIRLEQFAEEIRQIESEYNLAQSPLEWIGILRNEGSPSLGEHSSSPCLADLEMTAVQLEDGRFPPYAAFYDDETRGLVRECFSADFKAYGYEA